MHPHPHMQPHYPPPGMPMPYQGMPPPGMMPPGPGFPPMGKLLSTQFKIGRMPPGPGGVPGMIPSSQS